MSEIQIRRYSPDDVDAIYDAVTESKAELTRWMPWCHPEYSREDAAVWVEGRPAAWERHDEWSFVIVDQDNNLLGACGIHRINLMNRVAEAGYWVRSSVVGRGIATKATLQLCRWAFAEAGLHRLEILASVENLASQRVAEKAGATKEGLLRQRLLLNGIWHDCVISSILNSQVQ